MYCIFFYFHFGVDNSNLALSKTRKKEIQLILSFWLVVLNQIIAI